MNMPRFTAEDSLYKTSGHYQTGRHAINSSMQMNGTIHSAVIDDGREEVIVIVGEAPSSPWGPWVFGGGVTGPLGGGGTPSGGGESGGGGPGVGGGGVPFEKPKIDLDKPVLNGCSVNQLNSKAAKPCNKKVDDDLNGGVKNPHYFECTGKKKGKVHHPKMQCCQKYDGDNAICDDLN